MANHRLQPFSPERDNFSGHPSAPVSLIQYGDYTCPHTRRARAIIAKTGGSLQKLEGRAAFTFRVLPADNRHPYSLVAAKASLAAANQDRYWDMHNALFDADPEFTLDAIVEIAAQLNLDTSRLLKDMESAAIREQLDDHATTARTAGVFSTPTLFIDGREYHGTWDEHSILEAVEKPLGVRLKNTSEDFFRWAAAGGLALVLATLLALLVTNIGFNELYTTLKITELGLVVGDSLFSLQLTTWINDGLMAIFFLLVGIEIKRELLYGELSNISVAALPLFGALGGMVVPAGIYLAFSLAGGDPTGWGVPMATDIAFTLGIMALLGRLVPTSLVVFVSALAIADDLGAIVVIAAFYGHGFHFAPLVWGLVALGVMFVFNQSSIYARLPYVLLGIVLWYCLHESGLHATLAGVLTAALLPSRRRAPIEGVAAHAHAVFDAELNNAESNGKGDSDIKPNSLSILQNALDRLQEPGYHLEQSMKNWSTFLILPLFAFFNTGIYLFSDGTPLLSAENVGVVLGLVVGKPLGIVLFCWLAVRCHVAKLSPEISWMQMTGAGCLCGVGFTMSIFIASAAFADAQLEGIKLSILAASIIAATLGILILQRAAITDK